MESLKVLAVAAAMVLAPISAIAAPAESIVASKHASDLAPPAEDAIVRGEDTAKIDKVWWRGRAYGWRPPVVGFASPVGNAVVGSDDTAKIDKVWRRGRGWRGDFDGMVRPASMLPG